MTLGPTEVLALSLAGYAGFASGLAFVVFAIDKRRAMQGQRRVPEATLLLVALAGGWPGAKLAQHRLRHKTRKQPFGRTLNLIGLGQATVLTALLLPASVTGLLGGAALRAVQGTGNLMVDAAREVTGISAEGSEDPKAALPKRFGPGSD